MTDNCQSRLRAPAIASASAIALSLGLGGTFATTLSAGEDTGRSYATADELGLMKGFPPPPDKRVDKSNAMIVAPFNRWSYQNMRKIFPTAPIRAAATPVTLTRNIDGGIDNLTVKRDNGEQVNFDTWLRETFTDSLVVIKGNEIVWERYMNGMTGDQPHQMMSVTKSFAGLLSLMAVADGVISEDDPVTKWVPELSAAGAFATATVGQVGDMVNSMDFSEDYADPASGVVQYGKVLGLLEATDGDMPADNLYDYLATLQNDETISDGQVFTYQTPKADVVNWITNRATGEPFEDYIYDKLWSKLGTQGETYVLLDRKGTLIAGGGLNATPNNLARFAMMMLNDGRFNDAQVVPEEVIEKLEKGASTEAFSAGPSARSAMSGGDWSYRAQWWTRHTPGKEAFTAIGIHGQFIYIDRTRNVAIVKQSSLPESSVDSEKAFNINAFDSIIAYLSGQ